MSQLKQSDRQRADPSVFHLLDLVRLPQAG